MAKSLHRRAFGECRLASVRKSVDNPPMLAGALAKKLIARDALSPEAARKQISRASVPVRRLRNITFDNNQKFLYLDDQFRKPLYFEKLLQCIEESSKAYDYFLRAIINHNGFIEAKQLPAYTCSPVKPLKGHKLEETIISDLCSTNLLLEYEEGLFQLNSGLNIPTNISRFKAIEIAKKTIMTDFNDWARKINLISYNTGKSLSEVPEFYKLQWGFTAPSYIHGIQKSKTSPGFIVADILIGKQFVEKDIEFILKKIAIIRQSKKAAPFIPIVITGSLEETAFKRLKEEGILLGFIDKLFGADYSAMLKSLVNIIENASAVVTKNPDKYFELIDSLTRLEGKAVNLRGDVFELAVGYYYSQHAQYIEINKHILEHESGKAKEIDVFAKYSPSELKVVECKGYNYPLDETFVDKWLGDNIPTIRKWILNQDEYVGKNITFELWSTGGFTDAAENKLENASKQTKKYKISHFGKKDILYKSTEDKNKNLERIIRTYFSNEF